MASKPLVERSETASGASKPAGQRKDAGKESKRLKSNGELKVPQFKVEIVSVDSLTPHPRNYRSHPDDQLEHLSESLREHGVYRNVVIARDGTILAGHGVVQAAKKNKITEIPVVRLDLESFDPRALKVLAGDNEVSHLSENDDRALTEMLKEIKELDVNGLLGTGYDEKMLAALLMVTRPAGEINGESEAADWVGMPEFGEKPDQLTVAVLFKNERDRERFINKNGLKPTKRSPYKWLAWFPPKTHDDLQSVKFIG